MGIRENIFKAFDTEHTGLHSDSSQTDNEEYYLHKDPFDFYRVDLDKKQYIPVTQRGLRKAFAEDIIGIEFYIVMATSLRPLADEAQDIDEITRLLSQQKLTTKPNLHSITILRNLIKDPNPEIALYAAEGLNTIENSFIEKIQKIKEKISKNHGEKFILHYILGLLYLEFAKLLEGQNLIQVFYLQEALSTLKIADELNKNNKRILRALGETYILLKMNKTAIQIFTFLFSEQKATEYMMKLAECYFNIYDYKSVMTLASLAGRYELELDENSQLIIYQWMLNI